MKIVNFAHAQTAETRRSFLRRERLVRDYSAPMIEKRWSYVAVTLKTMHKSTTPENSLATGHGGCFERDTYRNSARLVQ